MGGVLRKPSLKKIKGLHAFACLPSRMKAASLFICHAPKISPQVLSRRRSGALAADGRHVRALAETSEPVALQSSLGAGRGGDRALRGADTGAAADADRAAPRRAAEEEHPGRAARDALYEPADHRAAVRDRLRVRQPAPGTQPRLRRDRSVRHGLVGLAPLDPGDRALVPISRKPALPGAGRSGADAGRGRLPGSPARLAALHPAGVARPRTKKNQGPVKTYTC